jgi:hypothetical protein
MNANLDVHALPKSGCCVSIIAGRRSPTVSATRAWPVTKNSASPFFGRNAPVVSPRLQKLARRGLIGVVAPASAANADFEANAADQQYIIGAPDLLYARVGGLRARLKHVANVRSRK